MTKRKYFIAILLSICIFLTFPASDSYGAEKFMNCPRLDYEITLFENGDARVKEVWDCFFGGDVITRYSRHYKLPEDGYTIEDVSVVMDEDIQMEILSAPNEDRPENTAAVYEENGEMNIDMYMTALEEEHIFEINYTVKDAVILHEDVAEFRWNLTGEHEPSPIGLIEGNIIIPEGTEEGGLYFWAHGPSNGEIHDIVNEGKVNEFNLSVEEVTSEYPVYVRFAMPLELFPEGQRTKSGEALQTIIKEEDSAYVSDKPVSEDVNKFEEFIIMMMSRLYSVSDTLNVIAILLLVIPFVYLFLSIFIIRPFRNIYVKRKIKKYRTKPDLAVPYYRDLPDNLSPAMVNKLCAIYDHEGKQVRKDGSAFSATLLDLIERGEIATTKTVDGRVAFFLYDYDIKKFTDYEIALMNIFKLAGAQIAPITFAQLKSYVSQHRSDVSSERLAFDKGVEDAFDALNYKETIPGKKGNIIITIIIAILVLGISYVGFYFENLGIFVYILSILSVLFNIAMYRSSVSMIKGEVTLLNHEGENHHALWQAYAHFLDDFTLFEEKELPDLSLWRRYLVYAAALGRSDTLVKSLRVKFPQVYNEYVQDSYFDTYNDMAYFMDDFDTTCEGYQSSSSSSGGYSISDGGYSGGDGGGFSSDGGSSDSGSSGGDFD